MFPCQIARARGWYRVVFALILECYAEGALLDQKIDPNCAPLRNWYMLTLSLEIDHTKRPPSRTSRKDHRPAMRKPQEISPQTAQMISVRDRRDRTAFAALFDHFAPRLKGFMMRSGMGAAQAEEIVQDVMLTVWRKSDQFDPHKAQVSAWIYQIAKNRQIDVFRKESRPMPEALKFEAELGIGDVQSASEIVEVEQEAGQLRAALAKLKPDQRDMIEKAYLGELTHQQIKSQTGLPLGTIKSRIRLGLERLRFELKDVR